ncbi:hypothetical protein HMPREF3039_01534 [Akkermansia sp. KLE1798]|nr:hypothetical protein HMPREF3039_01534 [Akkermansia sp. KLE1798]KZA04739.1 hypothetical protein HMPREF1326_01614 [Akkermansia sp. KLE1605]
MRRHIKTHPQKDGYAHGKSPGKGKRLHGISRKFDMANHMCMLKHPNASHAGCRQRK